MTVGRDARAPAGVPAVLPERVAALARRFTGRRWALEHVADWLDHGSEPVLLVSGVPGCGKTALAAWLAGAGPVPEEPEAAARLARVRAAWHAMHFCMLRGPGGSVDPRDFTHAVANQLASRHDAFALAAMREVAPEFDIRLEARENWGEMIGIKAGTLIIKGTGVQDTFTLAVREPLRELLRQAPGAPVCLLVDGLDESLGVPPPGVLELLTASGGFPEGVRLAVFARNEPRIADAFADRFSGVRALDLSDERFAEDNRADVHAYVAGAIGPAAAAQPPADPLMVEAAVRQVVELADGNFQYVELLLDEVRAGERSLADLSTLPKGLYGLYRSHLDRVLPDHADDGTEQWLGRYQPLLGCVSVAVPAAPRTALPRWLGWDLAEVISRIGTVSQLVEFEAREGGEWRVFHRSMADYLAAEQYVEAAELRLNRYYVSPGRQHARIVAHYLDQLGGDWGGDWARCDDYGLRQLTRHLRLAATLADGDDERARHAAALYRVALDPGFLAAQLGRPGGRTAAISGCRAAIDVALARDDHDAACGLAATLATSPELELRGLAADALARLHREAPDRVLAQLRRLLADEREDPRGVALKAAWLIGDGAREVFHWVATDGSDALRQAAIDLLYLRWRPEPGNLTTGLMHDLGEAVSPLRPRRSRRIVEFLSGLSVTIYINHCEQPAVVEQTATLWRAVLRDRLRLNLVNHAGILRLVNPLLAKAFTVPLLKAALLVELQDPASFFGAPEADKAAFRRVVALLDPATDPRPHAADLAGLFEATPFLSRVVAGMAVAIHAHGDLATTEPLVDELFERLNPRGRLWLLLAFTVLLPDTPPGWTPLLERLTRRLVTENREVLERGDSGLADGFDIALLPLGLAYGKRGGDMPYFMELLGERPGADLAFARRVVQGLGPVGFYHPEGVFRVLRTASWVLRHPDLEQDVVASLATIRALHADAVDLFLRQAGDERLQPLVAGASGADLVRRYVSWIGYYNNGVHQALRYPRMRRRLLIEGLLVYASARGVDDLAAKYTPIPALMLREADYDLRQWTLPE